MFRRSLARRGVALPSVLLVVVILSGAIVTSLLLTNSERRVVDDQRASIRAYAVADASLQRWFTERKSLGFTGAPGANEQYEFVYANGWRDSIVMQQIRPYDQATLVPGLYLVRSIARETGNVMAGQAAARREVTTYARWSGANINVRAGWTALSGFDKNGTAGTISGQDNCNQKADLAGIAVPSGAFDANGNFRPIGNPPVLDMGTQAQANASVRIDWDGIANRGAASPDVVIPGQAWPSFTAPNYGPVVQVNNQGGAQFTMPTNGRGILIVTGDLKIDGSEQWRGIILVGGQIYANGNNNVLGATFSGLNELLGIDVPASSIGNGQKTYQYDSCNIASAMNAFGGLQMIRNTWSDKYRSW
jgi:hypothetical protein